MAAAKKTYTKKVEPPTEPDTALEEGAESGEKKDGSGLHFTQGSLFEGDRSSSVLFSGSFFVEELHEMIELAKDDSVEPDKVRVKIFDVDEKYQTGKQHRVRLCFAGLQPKKQFSGGGSRWQRR